MSEIKSFIKENGRVITGFVAAFILFGGMAVYSKPENWWVIPLGIIFFAVVTLLFINALPFIKFIIALLITIFLASDAFLAGVNISGETYGSILMWVIIFNFFLFMSLSYSKESNQSRWTIIILTQVISFVYLFVLIEIVNLKLSIIIGETLSIVTFIVLYYIPIKNLMNNKNMPEIILKDKSKEIIEKASSKMNWETKVIDKRNTVVSWGEFKDNNYAIVIIPILLEQKFGLIGNKKKQLSYKGKPINPWLTSLLTYMIPYWKLRNISPLPVLYDFKKKNGRESKVIGVKIADRKMLAPFIITPSIDLEKILNDYQEYLIPINKKQVKALTELGE